MDRGLKCTDSALYIRRWPLLAPKAAFFIAAIALQEYWRQDLEAAFVQASKIYILRSRRRLLNETEEDLTSSGTRINCLLSSLESIDGFKFTTYADNLINLWSSKPSSEKCKDSNLERSVQVYLLNSTRNKNIYLLWRRLVQMQVITKSTNLASPTLLMHYSKVCYL